MPVVIHDFEVIAEPPAAPAGTAQASAAAPAAPPVEPEQAQADLQAREQRVREY